MSPLRTALALLVAAGVAVTGVEAALLAQNPAYPLWAVMTLPVTGLVYLGVGAWAWLRRPSNRLGPLFAVAAGAWFLEALANTTVPALRLVGFAVATVPVAVVLHALLAFPTGRLGTRPARVLTGAGYVAATVLQVPRVVTLSETPVAGAAATLVSVGTTVLVGSTIVVVAATGVVLAARARAASPVRRRALAPVYAYGLVAAAGVWVVAQVGDYLGLATSLWFPLVQVALMAGVPVAVVAGVLRGGFARGGRLEELAATLAQAPADRTVLDLAVQEALGDPSAQVRYRVDPEPAGHAWVDAAGRAAVLGGHGRAWVTVEVGDRTVGALVHDAGLVPDPREAQAVARVVALAVEHQRLSVAVLAGREELRESRMRLVESGDRERRRIARDLHDRLQNRLVLLAMAAAEPGCPAAVHEGLADALDELRRLVQGVMPALLLERGLAAAVRDLARRCALPVVLEVDPGAEGRLPAAVESNVYLMIAEALTNAVKHAAADGVRVRLHRDDDAVGFEVVDDGVGGAHPAGHGIIGIADRAGGLGGSLVLVSPAGAGTSVAVTVPAP